MTNSARFILSSERAERDSEMVPSSLGVSESPSERISGSSFARSSPRYSASGPPSGVTSMTAPMASSTSPSDGAAPRYSKREQGMSADSGIFGTISSLDQSLPSYLQDTCYAERFRAQRAIAESGRPGSASRQKNGNEGRLRDGKTDELPPLPSRWNERDKCSLIEVVAGGSEVRFVGPGEGNDRDAASVRADFPMPKQCGIYYYEVKVLSKGKHGYIGIGFCKKTVPVDRLPGWETDSWGYHGDDGHSFCCQGSGKPYGSTFTSGDIIGCGVNFATGTGFYTKNGILLGDAFRDLGGVLYPSVGLRTLGEHVQANFGTEPFVYDIDQHMRKEKQLVYERMATSTPGSIGESEDMLHETISSLVESYLSHHGFVDSARAFRRDLETEATTFGKKDTMDVEKEDTDAIVRHQIRTAIMAGDIDQALSIIDDSYPSVLEQGEMTLFSLRCRKFIELMRITSDDGNGMTNGDGAGDSAMIDQGSEEAPHPNGTGNEVPSTRPQPMAQMLKDTLKYGQDLYQDYRNSTDPQVLKTLKETFSLLAYPDPRNSIVSHLLHESGRQTLAEQVNAAILDSQGKSSVSPLERLLQQSNVIVQQLGEFGVGESAFINVGRDFLSSSS